MHKIKYIGDAYLLISETTRRGRNTYPTAFIVPFESFTYMDQKYRNEALSFFDYMVPMKYRNKCYVKMYFSEYII